MINIYPEFKDLIGKNLVKVWEEGDTITFETEEGIYSLYHEQDCCESVELIDTCGDLDDLVGEVLYAEESISEDNTPEVIEKNLVPDYQDVFQWTFYRIGTIKGTVVFTWHGDSNGYYSVSVTFSRVK